ncbi:YkvI family membrane protein [Pseudomonas sp. CGJS7]|uniref:YkvI family membrane protein n=1 Tax=Pseudomonas sp. CGJS7 TaxID=3109348 RepID=UPI00300ADA33
MRSSATGSWFQRFLLPGFAFKAVVIGGGYATGRELAEFFLPGGPWGGIKGMLLAMAVWSAVCMATFAYAHAAATYDYRAFFQRLLGPFWGLFELAYLALLIVLLAVFGAASGAIGAGLFGWPPLLGTLCLVAGIAAFVSFGNESVERLFKWVSFFLYGVYALFVVLALSRFGDRIAAQFAAPRPELDWAFNGLTYAGYNIIGAVVILPIVRHFTGRRDALIAGLIAGPLAMLPALAFFACMVAYYPQIADEALPSDYLLQRLQLPLFHGVFQLMIFAALLESGTGAVHAINQRVEAAWRARGGQALPKRGRLAVAGGLLIGSIFLADRFGLVDLIASGYRGLAYLLLAVYVLPLLTWGLWQLRSGRLRPPAAPQSIAY